MEIFKVIQTKWQGRPLEVVQYTDMGVIAYDRLTNTHFNLGILGDIQKLPPDLTPLESLPECYG